MTKPRRGKIGGACSTHGEMRDSYKIVVGKFEGKVHSDELGENGKRENNIN
jgi:hypothetical protein